VLYLGREVKNWLNRTIPPPKEVVFRPIFHSKDTFFYCDPPYINTNQGHYKGYTKEDFEKLLKLLSKIKGKFLLSSYPSEMLTKYAKQNKWSIKKINMALVLSSNPDSKVKRKIEVLIANFKI
jgi:DNA adenine methylase